MNKKKPTLQPVDTTPKLFIFDKFNVSNFAPSKITKEDVEMIRKLSKKIATLSTDPSTRRKASIVKKELIKFLEEKEVVIFDINKIINDIESFTNSIKELTPEYRTEELTNKLLEKIIQYFEMEARIISGKSKKGDENFRVLNLAMFTLKMQDGGLAHVYAHNKQFFDETKH
jgi:hypothetical protein